MSGAIRVAIEENSHRVYIPDTSTRGVEIRYAP